ncbi:hypothetical protein [Pollutimonas subterranea]|nr:hypothetical protein [Pollutimonas subterranea]
MRAPSLFLIAKSERKNAKQPVHAKPITPISSAVVGAMGPVRRRSGPSSEPSAKAARMGERARPRWFGAQGAEPGDASAHRSHGASDV